MLFVASTWLYESAHEFLHSRWYECVVFYRTEPPIEVMSGADKNKTKLAVELVRKGATMLGEPCAKCGGIKVSYHGKVYCTGHEDLSSVVSAETMSIETVQAGMREVLLSKLSETASLLGQEKDSVRQEQLVSLMTKYYDLLEKLPQKQQRP